MMLRKDRFDYILKAINKKGFVTTAQLAEQLNISEMTVRRDLNELAKVGKIIRTRGGGQHILVSEEKKLHYQEKDKRQVKEKDEIARTANAMIHDNEVIFLGAGTTVKALAEVISNPTIRILTNSMLVFEEIIKKSEDFKITLIGGNYRKRTGAITGTMASQEVAKYSVNKAFIGANAIMNDRIFSDNEEEGEIQGIILNHASEKIVLADATKLNKEDLYCFYDLNNIDKLIVDSSISDNNFAHYNQFTNVVS